MFDGSDGTVRAVIVLAVYAVACAGLIGYELGRWLAEQPRTEVNNLKESERKEKLEQLRSEVQKAIVILRELLTSLENISRGLNELERKG